MMSDEENDNAREPEAGDRLVGRGLRGREENPEDPQWYLANSGRAYFYRDHCKAAFHP